MPAGVDWIPYLKFLAAGMLSMMAGAQAVHAYYKPDMSIPDVPPARGELGQLRDEARKEREEARPTNRRKKLGKDSTAPYFCFRK